MEGNAPMTVSIADQIKEVGRELGLRRGVYPKFVARGSMTQQEADAAIAKIEAAYATLKWVEKHRDRLKQLAPELDPSSSGAP
jgi:hypothetical protein